MSQEPFLVVANFKSHQTLVSLQAWFKDLSLPQDCPLNIAIAPSFPHLSLATASREHGITGLRVCSQDVSSFPPGSYTGAVNATQLRELGVTFCLVGHSERRQYFHETSSDIANKARELLSAGITPIICLRGEDLSSDRAALDDDLVAQSYFCYEPPSDIGGTVTAPLDNIRTTTDQIQKIFGTRRVMYGGSVNATNISSLLSLQLAGVLVSTASLKAADFSQLISTLTHAQI